MPQVYDLFQTFNKTAKMKTLAFIKEQHTSNFEKMTYKQWLIKSKMQFEHIATEKMIQKTWLKIH